MSDYMLKAKWMLYFFLSNLKRNSSVLTVFIFSFFLLPNPHVPQSHNALSICCKTAGTRGLSRPKNASWRPSFMGDQMAAMRLFMTSWKRVVWLRNDRGHKLMQEDIIFITRRCWNWSSFLNKKKEEKMNTRQRSVTRVCVKTKFLGGFYPYWSKEFQFIKMKEEFKIS